MSERGTAAFAASAVAATLIALWLGFGVSAGDIALYAGYEGLFVGLPGVLVYRALSQQPEGVLRQIAIGWPLGYAIEVGAFALSAALGVRGAFPVLPLAVAAVAGGYLKWRRRVPAEGPGAKERGPTETPFPPAAIWAVAAVVILALVYLALGDFTQTPLPGDVASVSYPADNAFDIGVIAEAKNHWPLEDPSVVGLPLHYHIYGFLHMAAVSQVTGIEPSTLLLRLTPGILFVLVALQLVSLGRELGRSVWVGPLGAALVLLVGELDLDPERASPLGNTFFSNLFQSPSFLFGIPMFLAIAIVLFRVTSQRGALGRGGWVLLGILALGCGGAKASALPVVLGALVVWLGWDWLQRRRISRPALGALALGIGAYGITYALLYAGAGSAGFAFGLFDFVNFSFFDELVPPSTRSALGDAALTGSFGVIGGLATVLPVLGIAWVLAARRLRLEPGEAWLLALFLVAFGLYLILAQSGLSQAYFLNYGYLAGCVLSAEGIVLFMGRFAGVWKRPVVVAAALVLGALVAGGVSAEIMHQPGAEAARLGKIGVAYGLAAVAVVALAWWAARSARGRVPAAAAGIALLLTISLGLLNTPLDEAIPVVSKLEAHEKVYPLDGPDSRGLTRGLYRGLRWVRDHSGTDDVIAVNNHSLDRSGNDSRYFYYTAFSERRAFLESWLYTPQAHTVGYDEVANGEKRVFVQRQALNAAAFDRADPHALAELRMRYGVDLLLVDKVHGTASPRLARLARPVFENDALAVYRLGPGGRVAQ